MIPITKSVFLLGVLAVAPSLAQQAIYQQCGGLQWTGGTTCVAGTTCQVQNEWYSQCLPGTPPAQTTSTKDLQKTTLTTSTIKPTTSSSSAAASATASAGSISKTSGTQFIVNGRKGYFLGTNAYWIGFLTSNADIDGVFSQLQQSGLKILRIWGFNTVNSIPTDGSVYYQALVPGQAPIINTGANGLQRLDYVVQSAAAHGIKLIISLVNNWSDYGGIPAYNNYFSTTSQNWYTNSQAQSAYKSYIQAVVSRYTNNPAIFAWELANEPRCSGCATSVITNWASSTSAYIKSLDSAHLVALGDEGMGVGGSDGSYPFSTYEGVDFKANLAIPTIDFGTLHMYPIPWGESNNANFPSAWISTHGAACAAANKPCLLEEYGTSGGTPPSGSGYTLPASNITLEQGWQQTVLATNGFGGDLFWDVGTVLADGNRTPDDGNTVYMDDGNAWNALVVQHVAAARQKNGF